LASVWLETRALDLDVESRRERDVSDYPNTVPESVEIFSASQSVYEFCTHLGSQRPRILPELKEFMEDPQFRAVKHIIKLLYDDAQALTKMCDSNHVADIIIKLKKIKDLIASNSLDFYKTIMLGEKYVKEMKYLEWLLRHSVTAKLG
jgi:hypothetical protein